MRPEMDGLTGIRRHFVARKSAAVVVAGAAVLPLGKGVPS